MTRLQKTTVAPTQESNPDPCPDAMHSLELRLAEYLTEPQVDLVRRAYRVGAAAHDGQIRKSGEAYITHPVAVATILAELRLDAETLSAAIRPNFGRTCGRRWSSSARLVTS